MSFFLYQLWDTVLELLFGLLLVGVLVPSLLAIRQWLLRYSLRTRRRLPFGLAALFLIASAVPYCRWAIRAFPALYERAAPGEDVWRLMSGRLFQIDLLLAGLMLLLAPAMICAGIWWEFHRAGADRILARDHRRPVLLLRTFSDSYPTHDVEAALAKRLQPALGPFITLGSPNDFSPPFGARREYPENEEWQSKVADYLARAAAVVFIVIEWTPSLRLEAELVRTRFEPERTVLILPPTFNNLPELLAGAGVEGARNSHEWARATGGVVLGYRADWSPVVLKRDVTSADDFADVTLQRLLAGFGAAAALS